MASSQHARASTTRYGVHKLASAVHVRVRLAGHFTRPIIVSSLCLVAHADMYTRAHQLQLQGALYLCAVKSPRESP